MPNSLLVATTNPGKVNELRKMLAGTGISVSDLSNFPEVGELPETGFTFEENAVSKAVGYAALTGMVSLADDSGLAVDALGGRPGIHSARYAGEATPFEEKIKKLLSELLRTSGGGRSASFVSAMAIADADGSVLCRSKGICTGMIAPAPSGSGGFGYDPIFIPDGYSNTFAELPDAVKNKISHRARAFEEIIPFLRDYMAV